MCVCQLSFPYLSLGVKREGCGIAKGISQLDRIHRWSPLDLSRWTVTTLDVACGWWCHRKSTWKHAVDLNGVAQVLLSPQAASHTEFAEFADSPPKKTDNHLDMGIWLDTDMALTLQGCSAGSDFTSSFLTDFQCLFCGASCLCNSLCCAGLTARSRVIN